MTLATAIFVHGIFSTPKVWDPIISLVNEDESLRERYDLKCHSYASPKARVSLTRRIPSLADAAERLGNLVEQVDPVRRVVMVGHSQGGLVIQRYLAKMLSDGRATELARVRSVVMFATPNNGSEAFLTIRRAAWFWNHPQERELRPMSQDVARAQRTVRDRAALAQELSNISCPIPIHAYAAEEDRIVNSESAKSFWPSATTLAGDHSSVVKPESPDAESFVALKRRLIDALDSPIPVLPVTGFAGMGASPEFLEHSRLRSWPRVQAEAQGGATGLTVHTGPVEQLRDVSIIVLSSNVYLAMSQFFKPSLSGRLRIAGADRSPSGVIVEDTINDEIVAWVRENAMYGLPVEAGVVAATSAGTLAARGIRRIYHAAVAQPVRGTDRYLVNPHVVTDAVRSVFEQARTETSDIPGLSRSICFPLLGAGRGGLMPAQSLDWMWSAIRDEVVKDPGWEIHFIARTYADGEMVSDFVHSRLPDLAGNSSAIS